MSTIASLGYWPDVVICAVVAFIAYANRHRSFEQLGLAVWGIVAIQLWIALRSYATGDTFSVWMYLAFAACIVLFRTQIATWVASLQNRPRFLGQTLYVAVLAIAAVQAGMALQSLQSGDIYTGCVYLLLAACLTLFRTQIVALLVALQQRKEKP